MPAAATGVINYWAAAREAAGTRQEPFASATLEEALAAAVERHGAELARVLARCSFVIDGQPVGTRSPAEITLADGATIEVLPPFAGGSEAVRGADDIAGPTDQESATLTIHDRRQIAADVTHTMLGCGLLLLSSWAGRPILGLAVLLMQLLLVLGWFRAAGLRTPGQMAGAGAAIAAAIGADVSLLVEVDTSSIRPLTVVLAGLVVVAFVVQLGRRDGRARLTDALAASIGSGALCIAMATLLGARGGERGAEVVVVSLCGVGAALAAFLAFLVMPIRRLRTRVTIFSAALTVAFAAGVAFAGVIATLANGVGGGTGLVIAGFAVTASLVGLHLTTISGHDVVPRTLVATIPLSVIGIVVLVAARIAVG